LDLPSRSWLDPRVVVRPSPIHGLGLYAAGFIERGAVVEVLGGTTLSDAEVRDMLRTGDRYDGIALDEDLNLRIEPASWPGIYGNHSCDPNLWMLDAISVGARRDIPKDEELTVDYALFTATPDWSMACNCGSSLCRKVITGNDWERPDLQDAYRGFFAPAIARLFGP
jgi:SET domain-containing protein